MKKLYFLRHGLTDMNVVGLFAGHTESMLVEEGLDQIRHAGKQAKGLRIDLIVCSPLIRTQETARIFAEQIGYPVERIISSPLLIERYFGTLEGTPYDPNRSWKDADSGAETDEALVKRAEKALKWINQQKADHILVVSHGAFGRALRSILKKDFPMSHPEKISNAELLCWVEES